MSVTWYASRPIKLAKNGERGIVDRVWSGKRHRDDDHDVELAYTLIKHRRSDITAQYCTMQSTERCADKPVTSNAPIYERL